MERSVRVLRVFTRDEVGGNLLGIHDGILADDEMQALASALGYSETVYLGPAAEGVSPTRIFTPGNELPFAGHPLVGTTWHLTEPGATVELRCGIGIVTGRRSDDGDASIAVTYLPPVDDVDPPPGVAHAWIAHMPLPYEVHQLANPDAVASYTPPDEPDHRLVWAVGDEGNADVVRARFFAFGVGVPEDPATGSAAVALAAVQRHLGRTEGALTIHQGGEMGCPSRIDLSWTADLTEVGGSVVDDGTRSITV
jgi:trans-2,3-dihydro-3-hydroxyanthranilate isomerase